MLLRLAGSVTGQQSKIAESARVSKSIEAFGVNFFGDSSLESSKKKMPVNQKNHFHAIIGYKPPRLVTGKSDWLISFYAFDPAVGELRKKRIKLNHIKPVSARRMYANELIKRLNERLIDGWSPWIESENSNAYKLFSDVCEKFRQFLSHQLNSGVIRPDSYRAYISYLRIIEAYNEEKGKIKYIYQFDQSYLSRFFIYFVYCFENLISNLRNYCVAISLDTFPAPFLKGNTVQSGGNPIISATNRALSWELVPVWNCRLLSR